MRHRDAALLRYKITLPLIFLFAIASLFFFHNLVVEKQRIASLKQTIEDMRSDAYRIAADEPISKKSYEQERFDALLQSIKDLRDENSRYKFFNDSDYGFIPVAENFSKALQSTEMTKTALNELDETSSSTLRKLDEYQHKSTISKVKTVYAILFLICLMAAVHFYLVDRPMKQELLRNAREKEVSNSTIKKLAERDSLTNLPGRMKFYEESEREVSTATRYGSELALIKMDIHRFKNINQNHGQKAGDKILAGFARTVRKHLRRPDSFFRIGGDKFIILAPHTNVKNAKNLAEKIDKLIDDSKSLKAIPFKINTGIATCSPGETAETLLKKVDLALQESKKHGPGAVYSHPDSPHDAE